MLQPRPSLDDLIASMLPADWALDLIHWRDGDQWEIHLLDDANIVWFGFGTTIDAAMSQALAQAGGSFNRAQRPAKHQPAITNLLQRLIQKPKIDLGRRV